MTERTIQQYGTGGGSSNPQKINSEQSDIELKE